jgi:hypothetical protein
MVYLISYDLNRPGQGYARLYDGIKELGAWWHYLDSTWLVDTNLTSSQIFERLRSRAEQRGLAITHPPAIDSSCALTIRLTVE